MSLSGSFGNLPTYSQDGTAVLSIPVVDYALLVRGYYNSSLTDQDYLDRQSAYSMTFFLETPRMGITSGSAPAASSMGGTWYWRTWICRK